MNPFDHGGSQAEPPTIRGRSDYRIFLKADLVAHGVVRWNPFLSLKYPELAYQRLLRYVEYIDTFRGPAARLWFYFHRARLARRAVVTGISIPPGVFGPGLSVAHCGNIVVNDRARVGSWCRIHSGTNIGVSGGKAPQIGSRVYIAPGAVIYGGIKVGDGVAIGANAVVNADFPSNVTVAGAPARVISHSNSDAVMPEWYPARTSVIGESL